MPSSKGSLCLVFVAVYSFSSTSRFPSSFTEDRMCRYESQFLSFIMIHYFCLLLCMRYVRLYTWMRLILCIQQRVMFNYRKYIAMQLLVLNEHPTPFKEHVSAIFVFLQFCSTKTIIAFQIDCSITLVLWKSFVHFCKINLKALK